MAYTFKTERLDLGDGDFAVLFVELKHKTERAVGDLMRKFIKAPQGIKIQIPEGENVAKVAADLTAKAQEKAKIMGELEIDFANADFSGAADIMILNQVKEWSFGDVTQAVLDEMPAKKRDQIARRFDVLFPFPQGGGGN
jgi:hypothetical protein